jgi:hypothetical protein
LLILPNDCVLLDKQNFTWSLTPSPSIFGRAACSC